MQRLGLGFLVDDGWLFDLKREKGVRRAGLAHGQPMIGCGYEVVRSRYCRLACMAKQALIIGLPVNRPP